MSAQPDLDASIAAVLARYPGMDGARWRPLPGGLINHTLAVDAPAGALVLQRLNPIFDPRIHHNIRAVTERLAACGMTTPQLVTTRTGALWCEGPGGGVWRLMTRIDGVTHHALHDPAQARAAGALVGRFHRALDGLQHRFEGVRLGVHDTEAHLAGLARALDEHPAHPLYARAAPLGRRILALAEQLEALPDLPPQVSHGDLKISNLIFAAGGAEAEARCLIDLDTLAPMPLAHELGDAWRSWCNAAAEDAAPEAGARFDMTLFEASWQGYRTGRGCAFTAAEQHALLLGPEIISLELAARFCADALNERYFGWDRTRFARAGDHHLLRARGQLTLHEAVVATRKARTRVLQSPAA